MARWLPPGGPDWLRSGFLRSVAVLVGGTVVGQAVLLLSYPILTRLYAPEAWGEFGLFQTFVGLAVVTVALRYEAAILSAPNRTVAAQLTLGSGAIALVLSALAGGVCAGLILYGVSGYQALDLWVAPVASFAVFVTAAYTMLRYWFITREHHAVASTVYVIQNTARAGVQAGLGLLASGTPGLIVGDTVGRAAGVLHLTTRAWRLMQPDLGFTWRDVLRCLQAHRKFPIYGLPSSVLDNAAQLLPLPLIVSAFGAEVGGLYLLVQRILAIPSALIGASIGDVFQSQFSLRWNADPASATRFFWTIAAGLLAVGLVPGVVLVGFGPALFDLIFGADWRVAGQMAAVLVPLSVAALVVSPLSRLVFVMHGQEYKLVYDVLAFGGIVLVFILQAQRDLDVMATLAWLSATQVLFYGVYVGMLRFMLQRRARDFRHPTPD